MNLLKDYGVPGLIGLIAALAAATWIAPPAPAARTLVFVLAFLLATGAAQVIAKRRAAGKSGAADDTADGAEDDAH